MTTTEDAVSPRSAGVLLHPTSLPGPFGIGDLGPAALAWIDALAHARQSWWQILPLGPTGYGDSPYQSFSAFAGNPNLVSPQLLMEDGLLEGRDVPAGSFPADRVDYGPVIAFKNELLSRAWERFREGRENALKAEFDKFVADEASWLADFALFMAIKDTQQQRSWLEWPEPAKMREAGYLKQARIELANTIGLHQFRQFLFFRQWRRVKEYANS
ncbi:MAG TPA: 4-alpha-glucanotransferase, partial [Edaphobacter sp.]|nr:4-alpha-glucanotransferase [Edaphobacter sp.]